MASKKKISTLPRVWKGRTRRAVITVVLKEQLNDPLYSKKVEELIYDNNSDVLIVEDVTFPDGLLGDNGELDC